MLNHVCKYKNHIEESRDCTTFDGFLHSKMSSINVINGLTDRLRAKRQIHFFKVKKVAPTILIKEVTKRRIIADFHYFFNYEIESFNPNRIESDQ